MEILVGIAAVFVIIVLAPYALPIIMLCGLVLFWLAIAGAVLGVIIFILYGMGIVGSIMLIGAVGALFLMAKLKQTRTTGQIK